MYSRVLEAVVLGSQVMLAACGTYSAAAPGISPDEARALVAGYYWQPRAQPSSYTPEHLDALLRRSGDPALDGEYAEAQASRLAVALASVGDKKFAEALSSQSTEVKRMVGLFISPLWTRYGLHYPRTQAVLQKTHLTNR